MTIASPTAADFRTCISDIRSHLGAGTQPDGNDLRLYLACIKQGATSVSAVKMALDSLRTVWDAQIAILQAGGAGDISAEVDAAQTAIEAEVAACEAVDFGTVTFPVNTVADG